MLKLKPLIAAKAKENQQVFKGNQYVATPQNSATKQIETRKELSKLAGVSHDTISRIEKIAAKAKESYKSNVGRPSKSPQNSATISFRTFSVGLSYWR